MKIQGDSEALNVSFQAKHFEWKTDQTVLSVDACTVLFNADGTITLKSKQGKLVQGDGTVMVFPGWYQPDSETTTNTKQPVFKNQVAVCYEIKQKAKNRTGYVFFFKEPDEDTK